MVSRPESEPGRNLVKRAGTTTASEWAEIRAGNPFPEASEREPNRVMLLASKAPPVRGALDALREHALAGERIEGARAAIWIHYPQGVARSKLSPARIDRSIGSPATARNWSTVRRLGEMLGE